MTQRLEMTFVTADGNKVRISLPNADDTLEAGDVESAMNSLIATDVFAPGGSPLVMAESARIVTTQVQDLTW